MAYFKPMARIISHLGERLISSPQVALLELIKNSYDAKSKFVEITIDQLKKEMVIRDEGHGMNASILRNQWLVVGTTNRMEDKERLDINDEDVPLGEKGLGRFSTMKLGNYLQLETTTLSDNTIWNLEIDWTQYGYRSKKFLHEVENRLYSTPKRIPGSFTKITIKGLKDYTSSDWNDVKIENFFSDTAAKYMNPFKELPRSFKIIVILIDHEGKKRKWDLGKADENLLNQAHHEISGFYENGRVQYEYKIRRNGKIVDQGKNEIDIDKVNDHDIDNEGYVGLFNFHFYVFNRSRLKEITGYTSTVVVREILNRYTGGPMIFRDGFRIYPYGEAGDDWLLLNKNMYRKGKVRIVGEQTTGYIALDSRRSPYLVDQTNREGLVQNKSYFEFHHIVENIFKTLVAYVVANEPRATSEEILTKAKISVEGLESKLHNIQRKGHIETYDFASLFDDSKKIAIGLKEIKKREQALVETAAVGMTSMQIAHEIHNFLNKTIGLLNTIQVPINLKKSFDLLDLNLRSLRAMVSQIDEQATTLRRNKSIINLNLQIKEIVKTVQLMIQNNTDIPITILVKDAPEAVMIKANKGLLIQLFDNLLLNSIYWINSEKDKGVTSGNIKINIDKNGIVTLSDSGPGIAQADAKAIFEPFFSRKKDGRGLGLFISKEIAAFHNIRIDLADILNSRGRYNSFIIDFSDIIEI